MERIVLAYAGSFESTVAITWLVTRARAEVVTVTLDLGQGAALDGVREQAIAAGAARAHVVDAREEFAARFVLPALRAGALGDDRDPLPMALSRPVIARHLVDIARIEGVSVLAHGADPASADGARLTALIAALDPHATVRAPLAEMRFDDEQLVGFARQHGIPIPSFADRQYAIARNLWGRSVTGGLVDDPWAEPPDDVHALTIPPARAPVSAAEVEISFERGVPVKVNGIAMPFGELVQSLETIAGDHGVGRLDLLVAAPGDTRTRVFKEAPAAVVLHLAHRALRHLVSPADLARIADTLGDEYAELVLEGRWFSPTREAIDAFVDHVQARLTGDVRVRLHQGTQQVVGRRSPFARIGDRAGQIDAPAATAASTAGPHDKEPGRA